MNREKFPVFEDIEKTSDGYPMIKVPECIKEIKINYIENLTPSEDYDIARICYECGLPITWLLK